MNDLVETNGDQAAVEEEDMQHGRYLTFSLDNEDYGIAINYVNEIIGMQKINRIPEAASFVKGIINLRGNIIPIIDMRLKFKKDPIEYDDRTCIIIVDIDGIAAGLIVDKVAEVINIDDKDISNPPDARTGFANRYIMGIGKLKDSVVLLIDSTKLFKDDELKEIVADKEAGENATTDESEEDKE